MSQGLVGVCFGLQTSHSIGLMWWLLTREVLRLRGSISREVPWEIMVDLYFYRDPNEEVRSPSLLTGLLQ